MDKHLQEKLTLFREQIDHIDEQLINLLNQRAEVALKIGDQKKKYDAPIFHPAREQQVITQLIEKNKGPLKAEHIQLIWNEIMSASRALERTLQVAYLGPVGTYSEEAVFQYFGQSIDSIPCQSIDEVFRVIEAGTVEFGVVPIENSTEGIVARTQDLFLNSTLLIQAEIALPIRHNLLAQGQSLEHIKKVCAHAQSLAQCRHWLSEYLPHATREIVVSNAEAARLASEHLDIAAIASERAACYYGLKKIYSNIQDDTHNRTRFFVISKTPAIMSGEDKTSLIVAVKNEPGAMYRLLEPLAHHQVSMTRFESRPARTGAWEYYFYIDLLGHHQTPNVALALKQLEKQVTFFKLLGSYPKI